MNGSEWKKDSTSQVVELQEVVIQSFKLGANYRQIPVSSTLLGKETIGKYQLRSLKDAAQAVSNLYMPDYGSRLTSPVYIRGIGSKINSPSVGLYVDGVPYFEKSTFDFEFNEVASIEVLRGPQGTLFGRNTMGGIINIQTLSPFNHQATRIQIGTASYSPLRVSVSHSKMSGREFGYVVGGSYRKENGFFTNTFTGKKADPLNATDFRVKLLWLPSSKW
ncbi:MAG: TonB-dependent receptor plug domain-containing protein, partial [Bacteroidales bacterium]